MRGASEVRSLGHRHEISQIPGVHGHPLCYHQRGYFRLSLDQVQNKSSVIGFCG
jgi:hypothetical protein